MAMDSTGRTDAGGSAVAIVAIVILAALVLLFFVYGLPALRGSGSAPAQTNPGIEVNLPSGGGGSGSGSSGDSN